MPNRTDLLNHLSEKYKLDSYLEIGVQVPELNFDKIVCKQKVGVDPDPKACATWQMTSDGFFDGRFYNGIVPQIVFIDGLHTAEQVQKDFKNALRVLSPNGFIVLHDCNPLKEEHTIVPRPTERGHWNGDVVKFAIQIANYGHTVDIDNGCFVYQNTKENYDRILPERWNREYLNKLRLAFSWQHFNTNRKELLNLISWDEFISIGSHV
jgi:hypothetical protein